jgi:hypothetical protein
MKPKTIKIKLGHYRLSLFVSEDSFLEVRMEVRIDMQHEKV